MKVLPLNNSMDKPKFNISDSNGFLFRRNMELIVAIICCGVILNILFLYTIYNKKFLCKPTAYLLINLAACGILLGLSLIISTILSNILPKLRIPLQDFNLICKIIIIFPLYWFFTATTLTLTAISVWRFIVIRIPTKKMTTKSVKILCTLLWLASTISSIPVIFTAGSKNYECRQFLDRTATEVKIILYIIYMTHFAIPALTMIILYSLVLIKLNSKKLATRTSRGIRLKRRTTIMLITVTFIFIIFTLPWSITLLLSANTGKNSIDLALDQTHPIAQVITQLGRLSFPLCIFYHPIIYFSFRQPFSYLLRLCFQRRINSIQVKPRQIIQ